MSEMKPFITYKNATRLFPEFWVVTYKECGLSFPRYKRCITKELALDFMATLEGDDKCER